MSFVDMFFVGSGDEDQEPEPPALLPPVWFAPPQDELGVVLPHSVVVGQSSNAVVALRAVRAYSAGVELDLLAAGRGLRDTESQRFFQDLYANVPEDVPDSFLRVGLQLSDGTRVSNLGGRSRATWPNPDAAPDGPVLVPSGGGGGSAGGGRVTMQAGYWLWPLPPPGALMLFVEWPALDVPLSSVSLDGRAIAAAGAESRPLWDET